MPDNNEVQGAVCGTCGHPRSSSAHTSYGAAIDHEFIPAPVVPSDDADCERCEHAGHSEDACEVTVSHGAGVPGMCGCTPPVVPSEPETFAQLAAREFNRRPAPPTPSQDAEGDGRWRVVARVVGDWRSYERTNADGRVESHRLDESLALAIESAIRAPYEELVKVARAYREARRKNPSWVNFDELHAIDAIDRALESLGGCS